MTLETLQDQAHYLISQDPAASTNYVTDTMFTNFANEGMDIICQLGKIWECSGTITLVSTTAYYAYPTTDTITTKACTAADVFDVVYDYTGESLTYMNPKDRGKTYVNGSSPMWWYLFGSRIWLHPTPGSSEATKTCTVLFYGVPSTALSASGDLPPFPTKYHHLLVSFMAGRGKQVLNRHDEAQTFFQGVANELGVEAQELIRRVGKP